MRVALENPSLPNTKGLQFPPFVLYQDGFLRSRQILAPFFYYPVLLGVWVLTPALNAVA